MTGHFLSDVVLLMVCVIVLTWLFSALFGWMYLAWLLLPTTTLGRRIAGMLRRGT